MNCNLNSLAQASSCIRCLTDAQLVAARTSLLCSIANVGLGGTPGTPSNLDITAPSTSANIVLTWTNPTTLGSTNEVWRSTDGVTFSLFTTVGGNVATATDASGLAIGGFYYYKVRSCRSANCSVFSSVISCCNRYTSPNVASVSFPTLIRAFGSGVTSLAANNLALLTSVSLPALKRVDGNLDLSTNANLTSVTLTALSIIGGALFMSGIKANCNLPALTSTGADFQFQNNTVATSLSAPLLVSVGGNCVFDGDTALTSFNLNSLQTIGQRLGFENCTALPSASFPALLSVQTDLQFNNCNVITSISLPLFNTLPGNITGGTCPLLVTFSVPSLTGIGDVGGTIDISACALNVASVNQVLHDCVLAGVTTLTISLNLGTNAAPAGQGATDKATLITAGNTVNTN